MSAVQEVLQTAFTSIGSEVTATLLMALPIALGIIGLVIAVRFGIRWFRSVVR